MDRAIVDHLKANAAVVAAATGGIYTYSDVGRNGVSQSHLPAAYDIEGWMNPLVIVTIANAIPFYGVVDIPEKTKSFRAKVEIFLYTDGNKPASGLLNLYNAVAASLDDTFVDNAGFMREVDRIGYDYDPQMNNALSMRIDFHLMYIRRNNC